MARPQVHGYNMSSVAMLSSLSFASSAEEKVIRAFQAPSNFIENMSQLAKIDFPSVGNNYIFLFYSYVFYIIKLDFYQFNSNLFYTII